MTAQHGAGSALSLEDETRAAIARFNAAFAHHDVDGIMAAMTEDCLFDDTPPPDGEQHCGRAAVRRTWDQFFAGSPNARFETEEMFVAGDRAVVRWRYLWIDDTGAKGHVRGVDIFRVRDGKVAEKLAYVKG